MNYIFFVTWKLFVKTQKMFLTDPIVYIVSKLFPKYKIDILNENDIIGWLINATFRIMGLSISLLYFSFFIMLTVIIPIKSKIIISIMLVFTIIASTFTTYWLFWKDERYEKYFSLFEKSSIKYYHYILVVMFHILSFLLFLFSGPISKWVM